MTGRYRTGPWSDELGRVSAPARTRSRSGLGGPSTRALGVWLASRVAVLLLTLAGARQLAGERGWDGLVDRWDSWDVGLFRKVAESGYQGYPDAYPDRGVEAFFPGFPAVLRVVHLVVPSWTAAGLLVSLVAGGVASVALARLAELDGIPGPRAVLVLVLSPYAVFLTAGYSEALFLALALPGWLCARRGDWRAAGLLVALATTVRISGVFLALGLCVQYYVEHRSVRADAAWLLAPFAALAAYFGYLWAITGDPLRWQHVQQDYWGRSFTAPWEALRATVAAARDPAQGTEYQWSFAAEVVAVAVGVALTVVLVRRARWGEATYVGLSVLALATSSFYLSVARATLLWFPLWLIVAAAGDRRPALHTAYVAVCAPLMALGVLTFTAGRWVG